MYKNRKKAPNVSYVKCRGPSKCLSGLIYLLPWSQNSRWGTPPRSHTSGKKILGSLISRFCHSLGWTCTNLGSRQLSLTLGVHLTNSSLQQEIAEDFYLLLSFYSCCFFSLTESQVCCWGAVKCFLPALACETGILWIRPTQLSLSWADMWTCSSFPAHVSE